MIVGFYRLRSGRKTKLPHHWNFNSLFGIWHRKNYYATSTQPPCISMLQCNPINLHGFCRDYEGLLRRCISYWFEWPEPLKKYADFKYCCQQSVTVMFFYRITCKNKTCFIRKRRHSSHLLMKAAQRSGVIISCQMGFLCVWFNGFDCDGRTQWRDYRFIPPGQKIDESAYI